MAEITDRSYRENIAAAVRAEFGRLGHARPRLEQVIGKSRPTAVSRWHGKTPYSAEELDKVAEFLGITVYDLNESAALGEKFAGRTQSDLDEVARITPPHDVLAQPSRTRRAS